MNNVCTFIKGVNMNTMHYNAKIDKKDVTDFELFGIKPIKQRNTAIS